MYSYTQNPLLDFIGVLAAIGAGYVFVTDPQSPVARWSFAARGAALAGVAFVVLGVVDHVLVFFSPVLNGASNGAALLEFIGGLLLVGSIVATFLVLRGDLRIKLERSARRQYADVRSFAPAGASTADSCPQCASPLKPDSLFCSVCGARTQVLA